jgi:hypothetical protein
MLYVVEVPVQTVARPLMDPGAEGTALADTVRLAAEADVPQAFEAATVTSPPVNPAVALMEGVVEAPVQPSGSVQL